MLKVQFGCGGNKPEGFINHDLEVDIRNRLPYQDDTVDFILMEHVWEHIDPHAAVRCLQECRRILKTGGVLRLCVPVIDRLEGEHALNIIFGNGHEGIYSADLVRHLLRIVGFSAIVGPMTRSRFDNHWRVIGAEKDDLETLRMEAYK